MTAAMSAASLARGVVNPWQLKKIRPSSSGKPDLPHLGQTNLGKAKAKRHDYPR